MKAGGTCLALLATVTTASTASAHHEALFGPQSSLAVEAEGFASVQVHAHAYGIHGTETQEATYILSAGLSPIAGVPWSFALVQPFTYMTTAAPTPAGSTGPFSACDACLRRENNLVSTSYRFDFHSLQDAWGKDGNFALLSFALEPPTGDKDYPAFQGPFNFITAGMAGLEWSSFSAVALGYYRRNTPDSTRRKATTSCWAWASPTRPSTRRARWSASSSASATSAICRMSTTA